MPIPLQALPAVPRRDIRGRACSILLAPTGSTKAESYLPTPGTSRCGHFSAGHRA
uniref:hypothetical protein n=1 Tax=Streptomyces longwoodensis TaxID=68231 RepID=UPI002F91B48D